MIMCLTCGKQFANEAEAIEHNEYWLKRERDTENYLNDERSKHLYERRHIVQVSQPVRLG